MESIQLAQMLADLSDLAATQEAPAVALVSANKPSLTKQAPGTSNNTDQGTSKTAAGTQRHRRVGSSTGVAGRATSPPSRLDVFGRRILTPPMTRSSSNQGSIPGTPRRDSDNEDDIDRASMLVALSDLRAKLKQQQDNSSLHKAREQIAALAAKQQEKKYVYPKQA